MYRKLVFVGIVLLALLPTTSASASTQNFSALVDGQHLAFNPAVDVLNFDDPAITAGAVEVTQSGTDLGFTYGDKTVWLDDVAIGELSVDPGGNVQFANGSRLTTGDGTTDRAADAYGRQYALQATTVGQQVWGLGGADVVRTGSGVDRLVGNVAAAPLDHVSRVGATGAPTATHFPTVSADGGLVAFEGGWTSFGSTNDNGVDVLVKDMAAGTVANEHENSSGVNGGSGAGAPAISADGSRLAFNSASVGLVAGPSSSALYDIYVSDVGGSGIVRASTGTGGTLAADGRSLNPELSADGRYVVFQADVSNWASGGSTATYDIFMKDLDTGTLSRVSTSLTAGDGNGDSINARISPDGRYVVFQSAASNLTAGDTNGYIDIFLWDRNNPGTLQNLTEATNPNYDSVLPDVASGAGGAAVVVFETGRSLVAADTNATTDVYAVNLSTSAFSLVSAKANGSGVSLSSGEATISGDGRFVAFTSFSDALVAGDTNGTRDILVKDRTTGAVRLVSRAADGTAANQSSNRAEISLGGDWVVFESSASNLAATDGNGGFTDVFRASNPLVVDDLRGGPGNDTYDLARLDTVTEAPNAGVDTIRSSVTLTLPTNVERLTLTGTAPVNGTGNPLGNLITGNSAVNTLSGGGGNDNLDGGAGGDTHRGGPGNDTYAVDVNTDVVTEAAGEGTDIVRSAVTWTLGSTLEWLILTGTSPVNGTGNSAVNTVTGNSAVNSLSGGAGNDTLNGGDGGDTLTGGPGTDRARGGPGTDTVVLSSAGSSDQVLDLATGVDKVRVAMSGIPIGNSDPLVDGAVTRAAPGGYSRDAELVVFTRNAPGLTTAQAATAIGSATSPFTAGSRRLFVIDTGSRTGVYRFTSSAANAAVSAAELTLLATLEGTPQTTPGDYVFG